MPAFIFLLLYKVVLIFLNTHYPNFVIEIRHIVRLHLGFMYNNTYGTYLTVFAFFMILTLAILSLSKRKMNDLSK